MGAAGWTDWNLLVDSQGGPNHLNNWVDAAMIKTAGGLVKQPWYYLMGHFSRFLRPGMRRVLSDTNVAGVTVTAAVDPNTQRTAVVLMNGGDHSVKFRIFDK